MSGVIVVRQGTPFDDPDQDDAVEHLVVPLTLGVVMPDLTDQTRDVAEQQFARFGMTDVTYKPAGAALDATVVSQSPTAGSLVGFLDPAAVSFEGTSCRCPTSSASRRAGRGRPWSAPDCSMNPQDGEGRVTTQQPLAGELVARGSTVSVTLPTTPGLTVPNLVGLTFGEARQAVDQSGLRLAPVVRPAATRHRRPTQSSPGSGRPPGPLPNAATSWP